ncbi:Aste57867_2710 [Aphanomyces stellatus]|uniref:Aste57867_2710 protein n=1 Tax=Aphanomyces stellatus TaxID=120398 RepID=A0A485K8W0_9STRA|nr:hypothetical protein As57867_002703 [Aphanomyces stellatus]VFT79903.1 Aste57867_2710 [Aphanomyces stellatus]
MKSTFALLGLTALASLLSTVPLAHAQPPLMDFAADDSIYLTFDNGVVVNSFRLGANNTQESLTTLDQGSDALQSGQPEGVIDDVANLVNDIVTLINLVISIEQSGFTPETAQQLIQGIKSTVDHGLALAADAADLIQKITDLLSPKATESLETPANILQLAQSFLQNALTKAKQAGGPPTVCRRRLIPRGIGAIPQQKCIDGEEVSMGLCYPTCKSEFEGVAGFVCRKQGCGGVDGASDLGTSCTKPAGYGRGVGFVSESKCSLAESGSYGCEKNGLLWYPKCKPGFHAFGCCICTPDCPVGSHDDGAFCRKESYFRAGTNRAECEPNKEKSLGLCYPPCQANQDSVGPICSPQCQGNAPFNCGGLFCSSSLATCAEAVVEVVGSGAKIALSAIAQDYTGVIKASIQLGAYIIQIRACTA